MAADAMTISNSGAAAPVVPAVVFLSAANDAAGAGTPVSDSQGASGETSSNGASGSATQGSAANDPASTQAAVDSANRQMSENRTDITFEFNAKLDRTIVKIVDAQTQKVVQQIPTDAMLAAARALASNTTQGILVNTQA